MENIEKKITQNLAKFDICALLKLLKDQGYSSDDIYFQSNSDLSSRSTLCEKIIFSAKHPRVILFVNLGLLSANSPLPHFFRKKMDSGTIDTALFAQFISFFDHYIIKNLLDMSMPDLNSIFFESWAKTQNHYLKLLDLNSTSTLWHFFQISFPELIVKVEKVPMLFKEQSSSITLGKSRLGINCFLGKKIEHAIPSFKVTLTGEETVTDQLVPWPQEVKKRLKTVIFSLLQLTSIHFRVALIIKNNREIAELTPSCRVGYCRIGKNDRPLKLLLFVGYSKNLERLQC